MSCKDRKCDGLIALDEDDRVVCTRCGVCACCTPNWGKTHGHLDYECVPFEPDGCYYAADPESYPNHVCQSSEVEPTSGETTGPKASEA